ncbi:hypothetical protein [Lacrimispora xylanisolvens]|uniref:hypothetical protein n=1 Tax=Lacrimispora xylanisolvens TaxID=384636 RepID=UPI00240278BA
MMGILIANIRNPEIILQQVWYGIWNIKKEELAGLDKEIEKILLSFDYKLTSMPGIGTSIASKLIAEIGDI